MAASAYIRRGLGGPTEKCAIETAEDVPSAWRGDWGETAPNGSVPTVRSRVMLTSGVMPVLLSEAVDGDRDLGGGGCASIACCNCASGCQEPEPV